MIHTLDIASGARCELIDITRRVRDIVTREGAVEGVCEVYVPHTTAGVTINENADPGLRDDILDSLARLFPYKGPYRHCEDNTDAHMKAILTGFSKRIFIQEGRLLLGTWQAVYFCEFDGPRNRRAHVRVEKE